MNHGLRRIGSYFKMSGWFIALSCIVEKIRGIVCWQIKEACQERSVEHREVLAADPLPALIVIETVEQ
jgi:hypothetical protein